MSSGSLAVREPKFLDETSLIQLGYGVWTVLSIVGVGLAFGFSAVAIPQMKEPGSSIQLTLNEESWITSVLSLASPAGCVLGGFITDRVGRRRVLQFLQVPMCLGWLLTALASSCHLLIIGRMITGFGCGIASIVPRIYMSEFTLPNMRGVIGAIPNLAMAIGITIQAVLGSLHSWRFLCWLGVVFSLVLMVFYSWLPESPYYRVLRGDVESARAVLSRFRSRTYDVDAELADMMDYKRDNDIRRLTWGQLLPKLLQPASCKPFSIINMYILLVQLSGVSVTTFWAVELLKDAKSSLDANLGNVLMAMMRMASGLVCSVLLFRVGRRPLSITSGLGCGISYIAMGLFTKYNHVPHIFPFLCIMSYATFGSLGYYTLPLMLMGEMYPLQVRGVLSGLTTSVSYIMVFLCNRYYNSIKLSIGYPNTIIVFGGFALLGVLFIFIFLPETKELTLAEIEEYFNGRLTTPLPQHYIRSVQEQAQKSNLSDHRIYTSTEQAKKPAT